MELTGGKPQLAMGSLQADGPPTENFHDAGLSLHRAGDESQPGTGPQLGMGEDGRMYCNDMVFFPYLDDVEPGDGGLVCLPGSHKAQYSRPGDLFGQFSLDHHIGSSHPELAGTCKSPSQANQFSLRCRLGLFRQIACAVYMIYMSQPGA